MDGTNMAGRIWRWRAVQGRKQDSSGRACPHQGAAGTDELWHLDAWPGAVEFASEEQKKKYIGEIVRGEILLVPGLLEPGAGSDLAGLQTKAEDKGDHYLVNGQKVWTSYADQCD